MNIDEANPAKQFVSQLKDKDAVQSIFMAVNKTVQTGKNGKPYMSLHLSDVSGTIDARAWDGIDKLAKSFESGDFVRVKGQVQLFQNRKQLIVHNLQKADRQEYRIKDLVKASERDPEEMYEELVETIKEMKNEHIRQLSLAVVQDQEIHEKLLRCPAAKTIHHAYIGGLLEHVLSICKLMYFIADHYKVLDRDLLVFGAIFHDIGKVWELDVEEGIRYTDSGRLVGHLVMASELVEKTASKILGFPEDLKNVCKHIVLSHHGRLEYGSPKRPKFLEAFVVAAIDDFDSKMNTIEMFMRTEKRDSPGEKWTRFNTNFERYFYLGLLPDESE